MLSDRVQLNCPFVKYTCLESGVSWVLITHTAAIFSLKNKSCPGLPCPFLVVFSQKKDIAYSKLEIECSKSRLVPGLEFDQFPPQICCFDLSISTCD